MNEGGCNEETNSADYELAFIVYNTCCKTGYGTEAICLFQRRVGGFKADQSKRLNLGLEPLSTTKKLQKAAGIRVAETESYFRIRVRTEQPVFLF